MSLDVAMHEFVERLNMVGIDSGAGFIRAIKLLYVVSTWLWHNFDSSTRIQAAVPT